MVKAVGSKIPISFVIRVVDLRLKIQLAICGVTMGRDTKSITLKTSRHVSCNNVILIETQLDAIHSVH